jgi:hypothetical protein
VVNTMSFDFKSFNCGQVKEMKDYRWIRSEEAGRDLGCELEWIRKYAKLFREECEKSKKYGLGDE